MTLANHSDADLNLIIQKGPSAIEKAQQYRRDLIDEVGLPTDDASRKQLIESVENRIMQISKEIVEAREELERRHSR